MFPATFSCDRRNFPGCYVSSPGASQKMVNGQSRFRIHQITMGIGIYFDNRKTLFPTKKEHISPITEELPTIRFLHDGNQSGSGVRCGKFRVFCSVFGNWTECRGAVWPGARRPKRGMDAWAKLSLKDWSADDEELDIGASDWFDTMEETYYRGRLHSEGISLYELADDVFQDAGVDRREYSIDPYLRDVKIQNPIPAVAHKEALQLIANAGRCIIYQDREGKIFIKSSFIPDMAADSENEA